MSKLKIGIIREGKVPVDKRTPLTPDHAKKIQESFPNVEVVAQSSAVRCFTDDEYRKAGIKVSDAISDCDILMGVKEVPLDDLIPEKTYFFFSHTIKKQPYNQKLLKEVIARKISLVDYETLTNEEGNRVVAFGRWAGIVGAYNGIWTYGKRYNLFHLRRAHECFDLNDLKTEFGKVQLPPVKIVVTGGGRVAKGAIEVLLGMKIRKVTPYELLTDRFEFPVFTILNTHDYNKRKEGGDFAKSEFYKLPELYEGDFLKYAKKADLLIASAYWDPSAPVLFTRKDMLHSDFRLTVVADITCDIEGSIPSTKKPSTIAAPVYDYNPSDDRVETAFTDEANVTVMAVDNLPCELPRDASESFGNDLIAHVLPELINGDTRSLINNATIVKKGKLNTPYQYLNEYAGV